MRNHNPRNHNKNTTIILICILVVSIVTPILILNHTRPFPIRCQFYGEMTDELKDSELYEDMQSGKSFCFIGDSITHGNEAYGIPWYKYLETNIKGNTIHLSLGGWTTLDVIDNISESTTADVYVIAIGINDVLNIHCDVGADTPEEYVEKCQKIVNLLKINSPDAKYYFIAPWPIVDDTKGYDIIRDNFADALTDWCNKEDIIFLDPSPIILSVLEMDGSSKYMLDDVHPNATRGCGLYSYAVLDAAHQRRVGESS